MQPFPRAPGDAKLIEQDLEPGIPGLVLRLRTLPSSVYASCGYRFHSNIGRAARWLRASSRALVPHQCRGNTGKLGQQIGIVH